MLDGHGNAGNQPSPADGDIHLIRVRQVFQDFEPDRPLPRDKYRVGKRMHLHVATLLAELLDFVLPGVGGRTVTDDLGAHFLEKRHLVRIGVLRQYHNTPRAEAR